MRKKSKFQIDLEKYYLITYKTTKPRFAQKLKLWLLNMGLHCIAIYRFGQFALHFYSKNKIIGFPFRITYLFLNYLVLLIHKVQLPLWCKIGAGFHINHVGNIYLGAEIIGDNCTVNHNVTIGHGFEPNGKKYPKIGKNVWIGTGGIITGDIKIGDGVTIASGCILTRDVPDGCLVSGNPGRVILREYDNSRMLKYKMTNNKNDKIEATK